MQFQVPAIFKAIDRMSGPVSKMARSMDGFGNRALVASAKAERGFRKVLSPLTSLVSKGVALAGISLGAGLLASGAINDIRDYEQAIASFRTIVSDATDNEFAAYQSRITEIGDKTHQSYTQVASSFEKIAGLNAKFAETSDSIGLVSEAAFTLSRAAGMELGNAAENLVGIMNQFNLEATEADRTINVLAAGQAVGAASIEQTAESFKNFGSVASGANITLEESVALVQTLGKFSLFGAEAGTKLRGATLKLQQAGIGYASGQFSINDALAEAKKKVDALGTAQQKDAAILKMFGAENITAGKILLDNIAIYEEFKAGVNSTSEAHRAAAINSATLGVILQDLKNTWTNLTIAQSQTGDSMYQIKAALVFVRDNMKDIVGWIITAGKVWLAYKATILAVRGVMLLKNIVLGVQIALQKRSIFALRGNIVAMNAFKVAAAVATAAQWLWNAAMTANPIGVIIMAIAGLIALIVAVVAKWDEWGAAVSLFMGPLGMVISLIQSFRTHWDSLVQAFQAGGIIAGLKRIGFVILDALLAPIQQLLELISKIPGMGNLAGKGASFIQDMRNNLDGATAVNPKAEQAGAQVSREEMLQKQQLDINIRNGSNGQAEVKSRGITPNVQPTFAFN